MTQQQKPKTSSTAKKKKATKTTKEGRAQARSSLSRTATKKKKKKKKPAKQQAAWRALRHDDEGDVVAVVALGQRLYAEDPGTRPIAASDVRRTLRAFHDAPVRGRCVVAEAVVGGDRVVVGYAFLCSFWSNELGGEVCTVDELYVGEHARGGGVGSGLVKGLVDGTLPWFKKAVALELEVTPANTRARALYERLGFRLRKNHSLRLLRF